MTANAKPCTKCGEVKPPAAFYLKLAGDPSGPRRASCKACDHTYRRRRRAEGETPLAEIIRVGTRRPELLSEKAQALAFPDNPISPEVWAAYRARKAKEAKRQRQVARKLERELAQGLRPMRFSRQDTFA